MSDKLSHEALYLLRILDGAGKPMSELEMFEKHVKHLYGDALRELERAGFIRDVEVTETDIIHKITPKGKQHRQHLFDLHEEELLRKHNLKREDLKQ